MAKTKIGPRRPGAFKDEVGKMLDEDGVKYELGKVAEMAKQLKEVGSSAVSPELKELRQEMARAADLELDAKDLLKERRDAKETALARFLSAFDQEAAGLPLFDQAGEENDGEGA